MFRLPQINAQKLIEEYQGSYTSNHPIIKMEESSNKRELNSSMLDDKLNVYPVPASNQFTIVNAALNSKVNVFDLHGKVVLTTVISGPIETISCEDWIKGIYVVEILGIETTETRKVIIN